MAVTTRSRSAFRAQILPSSCHLLGAPGSYGPGWGPRTATLYDNRFLFTGREPSEWGHREMDGQAREGNGRDERERTSQYAATYRSTYTTAAFNFYEYRARAYNAKLGRFMSEDPKLFDAGDYNLFRYCHNDPGDNVDPMGLEENLAQKPISAWDPTGRAWLKQLRDSVQEVLRQIARQQAYAEAYGWSGHGAIGIGLANEQIGQLSNAMGNVMKALGLTKSQDSGANLANLGAIRRSVPTGVRVQPTDNGGSVVVIPWTLQLLDKHNKATFGEGIRIDERIQHSNAVAFSPLETKHGGFWTKPYGVAFDPWTLPFRSPTGQVTTTQTILVGGREATWSATVHANGMIEEAQYWASFH